MARLARDAERGLRAALRGRGCGDQSRCPIVTFISTEFRVDGRYLMAATSLLDSTTAYSATTFKSSAPETFDLYATVEAMKILEECTSAPSLPGPIRRMLVDALNKYDEEIEAYFRPRNGR